MNDTTPWEVGRLRMKIIKARLEGRISPRTAEQLQEIRGNIGLVMACKRYGIEIDQEAA